MVHGNACAAAAAGEPAASSSGDVQVLLAIAKALDPTGKALPKWRANNTNNWCNEWMGAKGCTLDGKS